MSSAELRQAAEAERAEWGGATNARLYPQASALHLALADWLDTVGADIFAYGPPEPAAEAEEDDLLNPHLLHGLAIARLINGGTR